MLIRTTTTGRGQASANDTVTPVNKRDVVLAALVVICLLAFLFGLAVIVTQRHGQWRGVAWFLNGDAPFSATGFMLGMLPGAVFGFVDQMALWTSVWSEKPMTFSSMLAEVMAPVLPEGELTRQAWGNLISGTVGTACALMVGKIVEVSSGNHSFPMYSELAGVVVGCLLGIYLPRVATGRA